MQNYTIIPNLVTLPAAEADEHNRKLIAQIVPMCNSIDDVEEMAIDLSGHLSSKEHWEFRDAAVDAWFDWNVNKICAEFA